jgi:hypothetical protein
MAMTKTDLFIKEIARQCEFVLLAAKGLDESVKNNDSQNGFFFIQALLTAGANISKLFWAVDTNKQGRIERQKLRGLFGIDEYSLTTDRKMRNHFDHFDERLDDWWNINPSRRMFIDSNFGMSVGGDAVKKSDFLRNYDFKTATVNFGSDSFNTKAMAAEAWRIFNICKKYESENQ